MPFISAAQDQPERSDYIIGFAKGLNVIQDSSLVDDKNLIQADNLELVVDGVQRRTGTTKVWDEGGGSYVYGSASFYKRESTGITRRFVRISNGKLQYLNDGVWSDVGSTVYTNTNTDFVQARNRLYSYNGTDNLTYYDGTSITTYTALSNPAGTPTVTPQGTTGSAAYSYEVSAFNSTGETAGGTAGATATGNVTLSATNFNRITWTAVTNAEGYNIWGRTATGYGRVYIATVYGVETFDDIGSVTYPLVTSRLPPEENNTGGIKGKFAVYSIGRQWVSGVTDGTTYHPTRVYYSGVLDNVDSFVGGAYGGGWTEVRSQDGGEIVDLMPFKNGVLVWKTNGLYHVYFTDQGAIAVKEITTSHGGCSFRGAQVVDNDIIYIGQKDNYIEVYAVGTQAQYGTDELRTNNISVFITNDLASVSRPYLGNICTFYYQNKFGFTFTVGTNTQNDRGYILDIRFGSWVKWNSDPMEANHYTIYDDGNNVKLYAGSNTDGYMIELMKSTRNDSGNTFRSVVGTKFFNGKKFDVEKIWRNPTLWFKYILNGSIDSEIWIDGTRRVGTASLGSQTSGAGMGADLAGAFLAGSMAATVAETTVNADSPRELSGLYTSRSIGFYLIDENLNSNWLFMGLHLLYTELDGKPLKQEFKVEVS